MSSVPGRLRVAVVASDAATRSRFAALVMGSGHDVVELTESPQAILTDGAIDGSLPAPALTIGAMEVEFAGRLPSDATLAQLDAALRAVAAGLTVRGPNPRDRSFEPLAEDAWPVLTQREIEVLAALSDGLSNKAAARRLGISPHTVKFHVESVFRKLGATSRAEAVAKGLKRQIVEI
jgi:DNA-binding CsgD family transcriptional regulator